MGLFDWFDEKIEIEMPEPEGKIIRRRVSKKWWDKMVAEGKAKRIGPEVEAQRFVTMAKGVAATLTLPLLERFPQLAETDIGRLDFLFIIASTQAGVITRAATLSQTDFDRFHDGLNEELGKWDARALSALDDCARFVNRSVRDVPDDKLQQFILSVLGYWVLWNLYGRAPNSGEAGPAPAIGALAAAPWAER